LPVAAAIPDAAERAATGTPVVDEDMVPVVNADVPLPTLDPPAVLLPAAEREVKLVILSDELLLGWHMLMPSSLGRRARQQIRRLSSRPC